MVLKHGASPGHFKEDHTSLMSTVSPYYGAQAVEIREVLILHGADVNARNLRDETALHIAVRPSQEVNIDALKFLLSHKAEVNAQDQYGETALHIAVSSSGGRAPDYNSFDMLEFLLQSGADQMIKSRTGELPFQKFLIRLCVAFDAQASVLEDYIQLFARFGPSPRDLVRMAYLDGKAMKLAVGLEDVAILKVLMSHGGAPSDGILKECIYSSLDLRRPRSLRVLMKHADVFCAVGNKHMSFLFLIKISRDVHEYRSYTPDENNPMETRIQTAKPLPIRYPRVIFPMNELDEYCDILKNIWDAGFDTNTILDENFVNLVSTYRNEFSRLVEDAGQFGDPPSPSLPGWGTISAVAFAAQHVTSATVVLALLKVNSRRDDFTDEELREAFIRSAVYDNLEVYEGCRKAFLGRVDLGDNAEEDDQARLGSDSDGVFERPVSKELRRTAEVFPSSEGQGRPDFYRAFCQAMRTEGFERKSFAGGRTLIELAERAENRMLVNVLKGVEDDESTVGGLEQEI